MTGLTLNIPRLETARLWLRAPEVADFDTYAAFMASDRSRFVGGPATDPAFLRRTFGHIAGLWLLRGYGPFILQAKDTGATLGMIALWNPIGWPEPELGWTMWSGAAEGTGFAHEAALTARAYAARAHGLTRLVSYIAPDNSRSIALAERLGATRDDDAGRPAPEALVYRHPAPEVAA